MSFETGKASKSSQPLNRKTNQLHLESRSTAPSAHSPNARLRNAAAGNINSARLRGDNQ
jgi:hypothetical protein